MNTQSIKHNIEIIANVGVLLGIILLAYEVNQNNQLLAAEARVTHMQIRSNAQAAMAGDGELMKLRIKFIENEPLTQDENQRLVGDASSFFTKWEWEFDQYYDRAPGSVSINGYIRQMSMFPHHLVAWQQWRDSYDPDFVAFMEDNVISQLE